ncbi:MAG: adenylate kinase, partial [Actinomycetes bacterium]
ELDSIFHQPNWTPLPDEEFIAAVSRATNEDNWVVCGNYGKVRDIVWSRADTIVVFDFPRRIVMWRVIKRTAKRFLSREVLWNNNRESLRNVLSIHDPEKSIISWAWTRHNFYRAMYRDERNKNSRPHIHWIFFTSPQEVRDFLDSC